MRRRSVTMKGISLILTAAMTMASVFPAFADDIEFMEDVYFEDEAYIKDETAPEEMYFENSTEEGIDFTDEQFEEEGIIFEKMTQNLMLLISCLTPSYLKDRRICISLKTKTSLSISEFVKTKMSI